MEFRGAVVENGQDGERGQGVSSGSGCNIAVLAVQLSRGLDGAQDIPTADRRGACIECIIIRNNDHSFPTWHPHAVSSRREPRPTKAPRQPATPSHRAAAVRIRQPGLRLDAAHPAPWRAHPSPATPHLVKRPSASLQAVVPGQARSSFLELPPRHAAAPASPARRRSRRRPGTARWGRVWWAASSTGHATRARGGP